MTCATWWELHCREQEVKDMDEEMACTIVCVTAIICITLAAAYFNTAGILWWYMVPLFMWMG